jgi:peptide/nickel transport system permease protein
MARFALRRLLSTILVLFAISVVTFLIFFATPGVDPAARIAGRNADPATLAQVRHEFGLDQPLPVRYEIQDMHGRARTFEQIVGDRGSRHQSALTYVIRVPDSFAFVISQDGGLSAFHNAGDGQVLYEFGLHVVD